MKNDCHKVETIKFIIKLILELNLNPEIPSIVFSHIQSSKLDYIAYFYF